MLQQKKIDEEKVKLHGLPSSIIVTAGLITGTMAMFTPWAGEPGFIYYLTYPSLIGVRILVQSAMILGWVGLGIYGYKQKWKLLANYLWIASAAASLMSIALTIDYGMMLYMGAHVHIIGAALTAIGAFIDLTNLEIIVEREKPTEGSCVEG